MALVDFFSPVDGFVVFRYSNQACRVSVAEIEPKGGKPVRDRSDAFPVRIDNAFRMAALSFAVNPPEVWVCFPVAFDFMDLLFR